MNKYKNLYGRAKKHILSGNMLLSKNPEMILPKGWPTYFSKSKNIYVWDLKGKKYIDMMCLVGQSIIGYANNNLDRYVFSNAQKGIMTSLNCPEEVLLAEKILKLHPWAGMTKFARSGGEANALAIRIARAATGREHIAISGYHGWHDWYLSVNIKNKNNLSKFLFPGLNPYGVPKSLSNTCHAFQSNNLTSLKKIIKKFRLAAICMEVARNKLPDKKMLYEIRKLANKNKIILIFDECTSGFRRNNGGLHMTTGVNPDLAMFGKALGNGYAISCVIGKEKIMKKAQRCFMSSTFWTERIGFLAALKNLEILEKKRPFKKIISNGKYLNKSLISLANKYKLLIKINGIEAITSFIFLSKKHFEYKTFISQEMLKKGFLASNIIFLNIYHSKKVIDKYISALDPIFKKIKSFEDGLPIKKYLKSPVCKSGFKRIND